MRRPDHSPDEPLLFDLPLTRGEGLEERAEPDRKPAAEGSRRAESGPRPAPPPPANDPSAAGRRTSRLPQNAPNAPAAPEAVGERRAPQAQLATALGPGAAPGPQRAGAGRRFAAGCADLLVHAAVIVGVLLGCRALGVTPALADWPPLLLFALTFSFFYSVVPLAFWGHTLGMAWAALVSHNRDGEPLTFDQTARRWLGGLLTFALAGLPLLTAWRGRTLADLLSGSETYAVR